MAKAVILFGHGSRDPLWRLPMEAVAARVRAMRPGTPVRCAYLELDTPTLADATAQLAAEGATDISILPMFLGTGRHAREDLPQLLSQLRAAHPHVAFSLRTSVGEDGRVTELLARIALE
jgi:sirohydrochlorin cobaltochelatase